MLTLLMTRPQEASERFVAQLSPVLRQRLSLVYSPLIGAVPLTQDIDVGDARGMIFSSANGVAVASGLTPRRDLPCFCIGQATTDAAQLAGWQAEYAGPTAEALIQFVHQSAPTKPMLHLRGTHSRGAVAARLSSMGCPTREQVIYDQPLFPLSDGAREILTRSRPVIVPLFSPRTARQFADQHVGGAPLYISALSNAVASPVKVLKYNKIVVAKDPTATAMAGLIEQFANDIDRVESGKDAQ